MDGEIVEEAWTQYSWWRGTAAAEGPDPEQEDVWTEYFGPEFQLGRRCHVVGLEMYHDRTGGTWLKAFTVDLPDDVDSVPDLAAQHDGHLPVTAWECHDNPDLGRFITDGLVRLKTVVSLRTHDEDQGMPMVIVDRREPQDGNE